MALATVGGRVGAPPPPTHTHTKEAALAFCSSLAKVALNASTMPLRRSRVVPPPVTMPSSTAAWSRAKARVHVCVRGWVRGHTGSPAGALLKRRLRRQLDAAAAAHLGGVQRILHTELLLLELSLGLGAHLRTHEVEKGLGGGRQGEGRGQAAGCRRLEAPRGGRRHPFLPWP